MKIILSVLAASLLLASCSGETDRNSSKIRIPSTMEAKGYPAHVHLKWDENTGSTYEIYRAEDGGSFRRCASVEGGEYMDFSIGKSDVPRKFS